MNKCIDYEKESRERFWWLNKTGGSAHDSLTVLDYFAAKALEGLFASDTESWGCNADWVGRAQTCYDIAEAMMKERIKRESNDA